MSNCTLLASYNEQCPSLSNNDQILTNCLILTVTPKVYVTKILLGNVGFRCTMGQSRDYRLLWTSLIFQVISWELDVNLSEHMTMKILLQIEKYFKFVL